MPGPGPEQSFEQLIIDCPFSIVIPPQVQLELSLRGVTNPVQEDVRIAPRFRCRGQAVLEWVESPVALPLQFPTTQAIVKNVSRTGFSVIADRQWYPEQIARLYLPVATVTSRVVRARRLGSRCYDIGLRICHYQPIT
jgi:hypothetical protein